MTSNTTTANDTDRTDDFEGDHTVDGSPPTTVEYSADADEQAIKLDLAGLVADSDAVSGIESLSIDEQEDGTQIATIAWESADDTATPNTTASSVGTTRDSPTGTTPTEDESQETSEADQAAESTSSSPQAEEDPPDESAGDITDDQEDASKAASAETESAEATEVDVDSTAETTTDASSTDDNAGGEPAAARPPEIFRAAVEGRTVTHVVDIVSALVDECRIHVAADGLRIRAVDAANVGMVDLELAAAAFATYEASEGTLGVDIERLEEVLKLADADDEVELELDPETRKLVIDLQGLEYTLACLDPATVRTVPEVPDLDLPAAITGSIGQLTHGTKAADMVADHLKISVDDQPARVVLSARGDTDTVEYTLDADDLEALTPAEVSARFSLEYLKDILRPFASDTVFEVALGNDMPLVFDSTYADDDGSVTMMLAPRIEEG